LQKSKPRAILSPHSMEQETQFVDQLFGVGAHFGYAPSRRHPSTARYIFGTKGGTEFFDLEQTSACLSRTLAFIKVLASERKVLLVVGGKAEARGTVSRTAQRIGQPYVAGRWIGGTLTNFSEIKKRLGRLSEILEMREKGELAKFTKHERLLIDREATDLTAMFGGLVGMHKLPDALLVIDPRHEKGAVEEARQLGIPTIALLNSDCDTKAITYPIPGNDASIKTVAFVLDEIARAWEETPAAAASGATPAPESHA
jgi:small subunit ribosomal protein S2